MGLKTCLSGLQGPEIEGKAGGKGVDRGAAPPSFPKMDTQIFAKSKVVFSSSSVTMFCTFCAEFKAIAGFHRVPLAFNVNDMDVDRLDLNSSARDGWGLHRLLKALWGGGKERVMQKGGGRT